MNVKRCNRVSTIDFKQMVLTAVKDTENITDVHGASIGILLGFCNELADRINELQDAVHTHE